MLHLYCYTVLRLAERLAIFGLLSTILLQSDRLDSNEASAVHRREGVEAVHGSILLRVEAAGLARSSEDIDVALVHSEADLAIDALLGRNNGFIKPFTLRGEVHAVVEALRPLDGHKLISELADFGVEDKTLEIKVSKTSNGQARGVIAASAFKSDKSVLDTKNCQFDVFSVPPMIRLTCQFGQLRGRGQSC